MDQMDPPHGYVAGMKKVYRNTENDEEWGLVRGYTGKLYYKRIIRGKARDELLPQNQPLPSPSPGYRVEHKNVYTKTSTYDEEWFCSHGNDGQVTYCLLEHDETTRTDKLPPVEQNESRQNDAGVNDGIAGQDNQPILQE